MELQKAKFKQEQAEERARFADELARSNRELKQFAHVVSHDLKTPLHTVANFCDLLHAKYHGSLDERADQWLATLIGATQQMNELIDDLLAFSRVRKEQTQEEPSELNELCERALVWPFPRRSSSSMAEESGSSRSRAREALFVLRFRRKGVREVVRCLATKMK